MRLQRCTVWSNVPPENEIECPQGSDLGQASAHLMTFHAAVSKCIVSWSGCQDTRETLNADPSPTLSSLGRVNINIGSNNSLAPYQREIGGICPVIDLGLRGDSRQPQIKRKNNIDQIIYIAVFFDRTVSRYTHDYEFII